ncbi:UNVERIFIED_CONTAM: hypothetical protein GTU68_010326 [Idotea baltica]|nr:hypothetical protein [Idotea baltica]
MKIFCIGRNYVEHAKELNNEVPTKPLIFSKGNNALLRNDADFYYPNFSKDVHFETELVIKICKKGKHIEEEFAHKYFEEISVGLDITARDIQNELKSKGHPWEMAKSFDHAAPIGKFITKSDLDIDNLDFSLLKNGELQQEGNTSNMIFKVHYLIHYLSTFFTLQKGDLIYTGTPKGVGPLQIGDKLEAFIGGEKLLNCQVK